MKRYWVLFVFLALTVTACQQTVVEVTSTVTDVSTVTATVTASITPTATETPVPSLTITGTSTRTPFESRISPDPEKVLSHAERDEYLHDLIDTNGGCEFPCIFGISPGDSIDQFHTILNPIYPVAFQERRELPFTDDLFTIVYGPVYGAIIEGFDNMDYDPVFEDVRINAYTFDGYIKFLSLIAGSWSFDTSEVDLAYYKAYDVKEILKQYGEPHNIIIDMSYVTHIGYSIYFYFPEQLTLVVYNGNAKLNDPLQLCPSVVDNPNGKITQIRVFSSIKGFWEHIDFFTPEIHPDYSKSVEELGFTTKEIYDILLYGEGNDACIYIPQEIWEE